MSNAPPEDKSPVERKLVAVLAADVEGYSRMMHEDEASTLAALSANREICDNQLPAIPILGDIMRYTLSPLFARAIAPLAIRKMFKPKPVSKRFTQQFPINLVMRPLTLRAAAEDTAMMIPAAASQIRQPMTIMVGSGDRIVDADKHSVRLHQAIRGSELRVQRDEGHMLLYGSSHWVKQAVINMDTRPRRRLPELETV